MNNKRNTILIAIFIIGIVWGFRSFFSKDEYVGFYYSDANNLSNNIQSKNIFGSLDDCRNWIEEQVSIYNSNNSSYDYECGKNCDLSKGKPYICEETLK